MPSSPPKNLTKISDDEWISSPIPSEIMAKTVPARLVEKLPKSAAKASPPSAPTMGSRATGTWRRFKRWMATKPPSPK